MRLKLRGNQGLDKSLLNFTKLDSFAPLGLAGLPLFPRLTPWAVFLRRFAADLLFGAFYSAYSARREGVLYQKTIL
jgi:hypothetical protein